MSFYSNVWSLMVIYILCKYQIGHLHSGVHFLNMWFRRADASRDLYWMNGSRVNRDFLTTAQD